MVDTGFDFSISLADIFGVSDGLEPADPLDPYEQFMALDLRDRELVDEMTRLSRSATIDINGQTGSYTITSFDSGRLVEVTSGSPVTLTVPPDAVAAIPVGTEIDVLNAGAGNVTLTPGSGVTINTVGSLVLATWVRAKLVKRGTDLWHSARWA